MQEEKFGERCLSYSAWHRRLSIRRFLPDMLAGSMSMMDLDCVEINHATQEPVALIETALDVGQIRKNHSWTFKLARLANLPAFVLLCKLSDSQCLDNGHGRVRDIESFRIQRVFPDETAFVKISPAEWAQCIVLLRCGDGQLSHLWDSNAGESHEPLNELCGRCGDGGLYYLNSYGGIGCLHCQTPPRSSMIKSLLSFDRERRQFRRAPIIG